MISQAETEAALLTRLKETGGEVLRPRKLTALQQDAHMVTATLDDGQQLRARYLVGADGLHSRVRESVGIQFQGSSYDESFLLADVRLAVRPPEHEVILFFSPAGLVVVAPLPDGLHRIVATVEHAPPTPSVGDVQALLDDRGPRRSRLQVSEVIWGSRFRVQHRVAERYVAGRVAIAGDAAHVHSPAGGQGMNTGIQDAVALAEVLAAAIQQDDPRVLARYEAQRRPVAQQVVALADRLTRLATMGSHLRPVRNVALRALGHVPMFQRLLAARLSGLVYGSDSRGGEAKA